MENEDEEDEGEGEDSMGQSLGLAKHSSVDKCDSPVKTIEPPAGDKLNDPNQEENIIILNKDSHIDSPIDLQKLSDAEDVIFEFYYNRIKISSIKTIYELINYQPTYRSISDPHIIYYKIIDREHKDKNSDSLDEKLDENEDPEHNHMLRKERDLLKNIKEGSKDLNPVISEFMKRFISPYVQPDVKIKDINTGYSSKNPYSWNPPQPAQPKSKIGVSTEEQRMMSKKATRICEAVVYVLKQWSELKLHFDFVNKDKIIARPEELFKNLLDEYIQKLLLEPLNLVLEHKKHKCNELIDIFTRNPYLLSFETRVFFFKTVTFAYSGEFHRTVHFLIQHLRKKNSSIADQAIAKQSKEKVRIDRKRLLESTVTLLTTPGRIKRKNFLEIEYCNEEGTGLGPTLEFYYLCSKEFRNLTYLWRETEDNSLFPAPLEMAAEKYGEENVIKYFETLGALISRAISDDRLTDLPLSALFWEICIGQPITFGHISKLDSTFGRSVNELRLYSLKRNEILKKDIDEQIRERQLDGCKLKNDTTVEDLCLYFVIPGTNVNLKTNGKDVQVTDDNLNEYLDLLLDVMLNTSISKQVEAFKKGFHKNMEYLKVLKPDEIELIVCGNNDDDKEWTKQNLKENIIPAHGYHDSSQTFLDLVNYMVSLTSENRRNFLAFSTGSPRLPLGGFKNLKPKMSVVRKNEGSDNPNLFLPSVMTCQNFLKIPEYSSIEILAERFNTAIKEGQESFTLS